MLNTVLLTGRLTATPEIRNTGDSHYCRFSLAVQRPKYKGEESSETDFFNCITWNGNADVICKWFNKGDIMTVVGNLRNHKYKKDGENRIATQVLVREIHFTGGRKSSDEQQKYDFSYNPDEFEEIFSDEDVPF